MIPLGMLGAATPRAGGGGGSGHRYWRFYMTALDGGGSAASCAELGFRNTPGGSSIATGGTPAASTEYLPPTYNAAKAFDGNAATFWSGNSSSGVPAWLSYDFGTAVDIVEVAYTGRPDGTLGQYPSNFKVQYSDNNSTWTDAWAVTGQTGWTAGETRVFTKP